MAQRENYAVEELGFCLGHRWCRSGHRRRARCNGQFSQVGDGRLPISCGELWIRQRLRQEICRRDQSARNCWGQPVDGWAVTTAVHAAGAASGISDVLYCGKYDCIRVIEQRRGVLVVFSLDRRYRPDEGIDGYLFDAGFHDDLGRTVS